MNVILHIGLPKTASSFLQKWLEVNSDFVTSLPNDDGGNRLAIECCDHIRFHNRPDFADNMNQLTMHDVHQRLIKLRESCTSSIVISSEYFYLANPANIKRTFANLGLNVTKIICFFRRQDRIIASGFAQDVKALGRADPIELSPGGYTFWYDWLTLLNNYQATFFGVPFIPLEFDHLRRTNALCSRWKEELGISESETIDTIPGGSLVNRSLPGEMVEICRVANELGLSSLSDFSLRAANEGIVNSSYKLAISAQMQLKKAFSKKNDLFIKYAGLNDDFLDYSSDHWMVGEEESPVLRPEVVARLLAFALAA